MGENKKNKEEMEKLETISKQSTKEKPPITNEKPKKEN